LTGLKIDLSFLAKSTLKIKNASVRAALRADTTSIMKSIDTIIHTVRRIAMELRPGILDDLGLIAALEWQLGDFQKRTGIQCTWISPVQNIDLDANVATAVFRIFQEALTNIARHSEASKICVRFRADADSTILEVEDNGTGIDKELILNHNSLGLLGMRERARIIGGRVIVRGTPGRGTTVTIDIPQAKEVKGDRDQEGGTP